MLYSVKIEEKPAYLYLLCEHQSETDKWIALRLLIYKLRIMELHTKQYPNGHLPPIYSMVVYTGKERWTAELDFYSLFGEGQEIARKVLFEPYRLIDVHRVSDDELYREELFGLVAFVYKYRKTAEFAKFLKKLIPWLYQVDIRYECGSTLGGNLLTYVMEFSSEGDKDLLFQEIRHLTPELEGETMTIAQQLREEGLREGLTIAQQLREESMQKGIEKGVQQGEATILKRQLEWRFGKLPLKYMQQLDKAEPNSLLYWSKRILEAETIEEVFA